MIYTLFQKNLSFPKFHFFGGEDCMPVDLGSYETLCQGQWLRGSRENGQIKLKFLLEKSVAVRKYKEKYKEKSTNQFKSFYGKRGQKSIFAKKPEKLLGVKGFWHGLAELHETQIFFSLGLMYYYHVHEHRWAKKNSHLRPGRICSD